MREDYPGIIYKYRCFDENGYVFNMIRDGEIWFSSARNFNDPFDTAITHNFDGLYDQIAEVWVRNILIQDMQHLSSSEIENYTSIKLKEIRENPQVLMQRQRDIIEMQHKKFGICSFSAVRDNILLWSHYAKNHNGVCIGFSTKIIIDYADKLARDKDELLELVKIKYSSEYPQHSLVKKASNPEDFSDIEDLLYTKASDWSYEKEYRLIYWGKTNFSLKLGPKAVLEIILGCCIDPTHRDLILAICSKLRVPPRVYQATKSKRQFSLEFERIL